MSHIQDDVRSQLRRQYNGLARRADHRNSRQSAIHLFCTECMGGSRPDAIACETQSCFLWPYRPPGTAADHPNGVQPTRDPGAVPSREEYQAAADAHRAAHSQAF